MDGLIDEFSALRLSAFSKTKLINPFVHDITIGPESQKPATTIVESKKENAPAKQIQTVKPKQEETRSFLYKNLTNQFELERLEKVQEAVNDRKQKIIDFSKQIQSESHQKWTHQQKLLSEQLKKQEEDIIKMLEDFQQQHQEQDQIVKYYHQLAEIRKQKERETENQKIELTKIIDEIKKNEVECQKLYEKIIPLLKTCKKEVIEKYATQLNSIPVDMSKICQNCSKGIINKEECKKAAEIVRKMTSLYEQIKEVVAIDQKQKQEEQKARALQEQKEQSISMATEKFVSQICLNIYEELQKNLEQVTKDCEVIDKDDRLKQFRFDCKKAINLPVNAISAATPAHLMDKYIKLSSLLAGKNVQIGDTVINASTHNQGIKYCTNFLAHKFVLQGDLTISSNPEAAFCYATIILSLWNDFPLFGKLLLAHFYKKCPFLVPMYIVKSKNQSEEEFYKMMGYQYNADGTIEKQDKYLKRLTGYMRLFSAIMVAKSKSDQRPRSPFGVKDAWQWLSCILNLPPKPDITATLLHIFFQNVGFRMLATYGKQFMKLMQYINDSYMPLLRKIDAGGPVTRLDGLLKDFKEKGKFPEPAGILTDNFW